MPPPLRIAVIGAGIAGLACARALAEGGAAVRLLDKGRGPGGRVATRRVAAPDGTTLGFDHGAQYATARDPGFAALLREAGALPWPDPARFVAAPGMSALARHMAAGLDLACGRHVTALGGGRGAWTLRHLDATLVRPGRPVPEDAAAEVEGPFDRVAVTLPAPQALPLLGGHLPPEAQARLAAVRIAPCWTVMAAFPARLDLPDWLRPGDGGVLGWAARDSAKPGRAAGTEAWVVQAGPAWSRDHLEAGAETVIPALLAALGARAGAPLPAPDLALAHRWRYALVEAPLGAPCLWDAATGIGLAGDWCLEGRVESAFLSGRALARAMLAGEAAPRPDGGA